mmetsp:Transcript_74417/g.150461  ORF Transcript_74417/g.150461 Transcript_74417/m.150461 type:complete len:128 (-) Transcript_74417:180-563(-)
MWNPSKQWLFKDLTQRKDLYGNANPKFQQHISIAQRPQTLDASDENESTQNDVEHNFFVACYTDALCHSNSGPNASAKNRQRTAQAVDGEKVLYPLLGCHPTWLRRYFFCGGASCTCVDRDRAPERL